MTHRTRLALALAAAVLAAPAHAATPINQTRPLAADGRVSVSNIAGRITVRTWDQAQVRITGSLGEGVEKLEIEGDSRNLDIEVKYPENGRRWFSGRDIEDTVLEIMVPRRAELDVEAVSADIDVSGVRGRRLEVASVSGDVNVAGSAPGEARIGNVSGDLELWLDTDQLSIENVSGDINVHGALTGEIDIESVSGQVTLAGRQLRRLSVSTVSGDADLRLALADGGEIDAESVSGNLILALPAGTGAHLSLETFSGDIRSPVGRVEEEEHGPGRSLDARMGDGKGDIRMESFSGDIRIRTGEGPAKSGAAPDVE